VNNLKSAVILSALPAILLLGGCKHNDGSGPKVTGNIDPNQVIAKNKEDTASKALSDGKELKASPITTAFIATQDGKASAATASDFSIKKDGTGAILTVNGEKIAFADKDKSDDGGWEREDSSKYEGLFLVSGDNAGKALNGTDANYLQVWQYSKFAGNQGYRGFGVVGAETDPSVVKSAANATYKGTAGAETWATADSQLRTQVRGDLTLNADFQKGSVTGSIDNLSRRSRDGNVSSTYSPWTAAAAGTSIAMTESKISGNGFSGGTLVANDPGGDVGNLAGSTYSGKFYGPNAEQVGGVMSLNGKTTDGSYVGTGYFAGDKAK